MIARLKKLFWTFASNNFSDITFLKLKYRRVMKQRLNLKNPKAFTEKLNWLKIYDHNPLYTTMVDKYRVKEYVKQIIGPEHIIPTIAAWDTVEQIDFDILPDRFVLKSNHNSFSGVIICSNKSLFNRKEAVEKMRLAMKEDYFVGTREWPYKNVKRMIIAETLIEDSSIGDLRDFKFFCFNGKVRFFKIDFDRQTAHRANYFLPDGTLLPFGELACPRDPTRNIEIPTNLKDMIDIAEKLSINRPFLRVDLYNVNGKIYFGELTLYPASGFGSFEPTDWDYKIGQMLCLPSTANISLQQ